MEWRRRHVLGLSDFRPEEIEFVIDTARSMEEVLTRDIKKVPALRGKTVVNLFFEASTRTRTSFEIAGKRLSADVVNFSSSTSSITKGETLLDTARNIEAMKPNILVIRHPASGAPHFLSRHLTCSIVNAGDGANVGAWERATHSAAQAVSLATALDVDADLHDRTQQMLADRPVVAEALVHLGASATRPLCAEVRHQQPLVVRRHDGSYRLPPIEPLP